MKTSTRLGVASAMALAAAPLWACSICRCGDPTFNALGKDGVAQTGLRLALDWDQLDKTQGPADEFDSMHEQRVSALLAYGVSDRFGLFARVPYSTRSLTETVQGESTYTHTSGLSDPEIYGQARLWSSAFDGAVGVRTSLYAVFGVKTAWGQNDVRQNGERVDEHAQPGTGSTDWFGGLSGSYQINPHSALFASAQYRHTGRNDFGYRYGQVTLANVAYEHKLDARWDTVLEINYRHSGFDQTDASGTIDPNTGGTIVYVTPRVLFNVGGGWVLRTSAQIPLSQSGLNGYQHESVVFNLGVTRLFRS
jgi:hypothetical protein